MTASPPMKPRRGLLLVISSPSGAGKTSLCRRLISEQETLVLSVSATTRPPRAGEADGREYRFLDAATFAAMIDEGAFLEWAVVHDHRYGTPKADIEKAMAQGRDVLFDIDWQGARAIRAQAQEDTVSVFVLPPSMEELARRLRLRAQDSETEIARRLAGAKTEIEKWSDYDYVIVNDDLETSYQALCDIYLAERGKRFRNPWIEPFVGGLLEEDPGA
jgi:guanylate kinase